MAMKNLIGNAALLGAATLALAGCDTFDVSVCRQPDKVCSSEALKDLPGVPFNSRVPERAHYTKWLVPFDTITVATKLVDDKGKDVAAFHPDIPKPAYVYPHQAHADELLQAVSAIAENYQGAIEVTDQDEASRQVQKITMELRPYFAKLADEAAGIPPSGQLAGNDIETQTVIDDAVYYLNYKRPLTGSVDGHVTLGADGTLSSAEGNISDTTISSLLGALQSAATAGGAAAPAAAVAATTTPTVASNTSHSRRLGQRVCKTTPGVSAAKCAPKAAEAPKPKFKLTVAITITTTLQMIALKETCADGTCDAAVLTTLSLCDARHDKQPTDACPHGDTKKPVQIASITPYPPPAPPAATDDTKKKKKAAKDATSKDDSAGDK
ncbi:MAG: hypothetical protein ABSD74_14760 [Rhizomicrobium sp.]